ncbi:MAG TPA: ankyrin repeat domain-containing protein [Candidatus Babeliales bacterium]|nr:ankyrin repeat domain-containing protein [Candidatus Babeliales bacterium]
MNMAEALLTAGLALLGVGSPQDGAIALQQQVPQQEMRPAVDEESRDPVVVAKKDVSHSVFNAACVAEYEVAKQLLGEVRKGKATINPGYVDPKSGRALLEVACKYCRDLAKDLRFLPGFNRAQIDDLLLEELLQNNAEERKELAVEQKGESLLQATRLQQEALQAIQEEHVQVKQDASRVLFDIMIKARYKEINKKYVDVKPEEVNGWLGLAEAGYVTINPNYAPLKPKSDTPESEQPLFDRNLLALAAQRNLFVQRFLDLNADPNAVCSVDGRTPLFSAIAADQVEATQILLNGNANVNTVTKPAADTPLLYALCRSNDKQCKIGPQMVELLLNNKADVEAKTKVVRHNGTIIRQSCSAWDYAKPDHHPKVHQLLLAHANKQQQR